MVTVGAAFPRADDVAPLDVREQEALKRLVSGADQGAATLRNRNGPVSGP